MIARYKDRLPARLFEYWLVLGFSDFKDGLFWITNPDDFEDEMEVWVGDTPIVGEDAYYVITRSGFSDLYLWGKKNGWARWRMTKYFAFEPALVAGGTRQLAYLARRNVHVHLHILAQFRSARNSRS